MFTFHYDLQLIFKYVQSIYLYSSSIIALSLYIYCRALYLQQHLCLYQKHSRFIVLCIYSSIYLQVSYSLLQQVSAVKISIHKKISINHKHWSFQDVTVLWSCVYIRSIHQQFISYHSHSKKAQVLSSIRHQEALQ